MSKKKEVIPLDSATHKQHERNEDNPIEEALNRFLSAVDDYREAILTSVRDAYKSHVKKSTVVRSKIQEYLSDIDTDGTVTLKEAHEAKKFFDAIKEAERLRKSRLPQLLERSLFIGIFSEFDSFIGALLKAIYSKQPSLYRGIKKEIALSDLLDYPNLDDIKREILDQEIDSFRRGSYIEQFTELERKFEIKTLRDFPEWSDFIECSQRRNLMTHNDGRVSQQYLTVCKREGVKFNSEPKVGDVLNLEPQYLFDSIIIISKVAFMLTHTLWRKVVAEEIEKANDAMNNAIYRLLESKRWRAASELGNFSLSPMMIKGAKDLTKMIRVVNTAIALKQCKSKEDAEKLLDTLDLSGSTREFKLANAVIREEYKNASDLMRDIGKSGELLDELSYYSWPLFEEFRGQVEFQEAFKEIYGRPFKHKLSEQAQKGISKKDSSNTKKRAD